MSLCAPKGKALVICGERGSGKTSLAMVLANRFPGFYTVCSMHDLTEKFKPMLARSPGTLIIEEFTADDLKNLDVIKSLLCNETVRVELKGQDSKEVPVPARIIICTTLLADEFHGDYRRFVTLTIGGALCHTPS